VVPGGEVGVKRTTCAACGHVELDTFLNLGDSPIADAYTATPDEPVARYPLEVAVCAKCRLVQLLEVVDHDVLFGTGYSFYSSASPPLSAYHAAYARDVRAAHPDLLRRGVLEVGCNDGDLLRHFADVEHRGVDPAQGPTDLARSRGLDVITRPFGLAAAHELRDRRGRQGVVIANHVLAHVADVADVLAGISALLAHDGVAMVEVQYLPDLLVNNAFDLVYHEHRNFFSLTSLEQAALRHGLHVADAELTDRQGGSLRVTFRGRANVLPPRVGEILRAERWLNSWSAYEGMQGRAERIRARLWDLLGSERAAGRTPAGYGAPAKATTLLAFCGIGQETIPWVVDTTEAKQGRHIPGTGIPIVAPDAAPHADAHVLLSWNYARQIMRNNPGGRWIVPFPAPVVL
jgi:SAM-dependent methyltransferase